MDIVLKDYVIRDLEKEISSGVFVEDKQRSEYQMKVKHTVRGFMSLFWFCPQGWLINGNAFIRPKYKNFVCVQLVLEVNCKSTIVIFQYVNKTKSLFILKAICFI